MMMAHNSKKQHAILAMTLLIVSIIILYLKIITPALETRKAHLEEISDLQFQINKLHERIANANSAKITLQVDNNSDEQGFIFESNPSMAKASLQQLTSKLVKNAGGTLVSAHVTESNDSYVFPELSIQLHMRSDIAALQKIIFDMEYQKISLFIRSLSMQSIKRRNNNTDELDVRLHLSAYMNNERGSS